MINNTPFEFRKMVEHNKYKKHTSGICPGYAQGNVVIIPQKYAYDFLVFAFRNPKACPVIGIGDVGQKVISNCAGNSDIYKAIPLYNIFSDGELIGTSEDVSDLYKEDFVVFVIGCSFTFESELMKEGIELKHIKENKNVAMYDTNIKLTESGLFKGNMVVSMRPIKKSFVEHVIKITSKFPSVHGSPVHIGNPEEIGINNLSKPDYGDSVVCEDDEVAVFWACGVTSQNALRNAKLPIAITHSPGYMLITDIKNEALKI